MDDLKTKFDKLDIVVWDNGGETMDRYTVLLDKQYVFGMSGSPSHPQGFNQYAGDINDWEVYSDYKHFISLWDKKEVRLNFEEVPESVKEAIKYRMEDE